MTKKELIEDQVDWLADRIVLCGDSKALREMAVVKILAVFGEADEELPF